MRSDDSSYDLVANVTLPRRVAARRLLHESPQAASLLRDDEDEMDAFHLTGLNHDLYFANRGTLVSIVMTAAVDEVGERVDAAMAYVARQLTRART